tara:strand:- start:710 stop:862 length:153 start_codon:yes stop_codon:yes gene_type:complete
MNEEELKKLSEHFFEKCPTEARNFFHRILEKLEDIDKKIEALELKTDKTT